jgi:hypothetical protein
VSQLPSLQNQAVAAAIRAGLEVRADWELHGTFTRWGKRLRTCGSTTGA